MTFDAVPERYSFPEEEEAVLRLWDELDAFKTSLKLAEGRERFSFYDGPPFATGLPHYGHLLAGTIKDIVPRYWAQRGFYVERRFGWDCHGLPVEHEIDKKLNIQGKADVMKMGIAKYNEHCRAIVMRYSEEWKSTVKRLGRWIDFDNDYKTLYPWFMESEWWVFSELFKQGLVYRGYRVMPYSTACCTPLSNFEVAQNYKDTTDPSVIVSFPLLGEEEVSLLAWTTTPWTLPSNLALAVNPDMEYVKIKDIDSGNVYILMTSRLCILYKDPKKAEGKKFTVLEHMKGASLVNLRYKPLFDYFSERADSGSFIVMPGSHVTDESGTGIVHCAPAFGEDDYRVCLEHGVITKGGDVPCPVDEAGKFTAVVSDFAGQHVKEADKHIIKAVKQMGRLVSSFQYTHSYPFCWRSDTPLIYKAVPSWFVRVEEIKKRLVECNKETRWVPEFVGANRFHNWLEGAIDWCVSRNRYWGTPLPLWISDDFEEVVCVSSIAELAELSGTTVTDLHRESVDGIKIPSKKGKGMLSRCEEVFDCWFESGCMPYAQKHYPFENKELFRESFPANFIAEGLDQTRGWFYTLLVLSTALFGVPPAKNIVCNGLVLAADGKKMSKRLQNYPDPNEVLHSFGADALRLYMINSPVVRAETLRFKEEGVRDVIKDVFLPWYNAYRFLVQNVHRFEASGGVNFQHDMQSHNKSANVMDRWILAALQTLITFVNEEMAAYRLYTVVPRLLKFIDNLTNWYVRLNRKRMRGEEGATECEQSLAVLYEVLYMLAKLMAPFTPFLTENMYQNLRKGLRQPDVTTDDRSIHYLPGPMLKPEYLDPVIEKRVQAMMSVVELGRVARERTSLPVKYPLQELVVINNTQSFLDDVDAMQHYVKRELNVKRLTLCAEEHKYGLSRKAKPNSKVLGQRLGPEFKKVLQAVQKLSDEDIHRFVKDGQLDVCGHVLSDDDLLISWTHEKSANGDNKYESNSNGDVVVLLDTTHDTGMRQEGLAREIVNRIQKLRKKAKLAPTDPVLVVCHVLKDHEDDQLAQVAVDYKEMIEQSIGQPLLVDDKLDQTPLAVEEFEVGNGLISLAVHARTQ